MRRVNRIPLLIIFWLAFGGWISLVPAAAPAKLALVVGNAAYRGANPLTNTRHDAQDMVAMLRGLGFQVTAVEDATRDQFNLAVKTFVKSLQGTDAMGLFYYAGHGIQMKGANYLLPVDAKIEEEWDVQDQAIALDRLLDGMASGRDKAVNLVILDACRDNPFAVRGSRSTGADRGFARVEPSSGTLVLYAAQPGATASDNPGGRNGLFTGELLKVLATPGLQVEEAFKQVAQQVYLTSGNQKQLPWQEGIIFGKVYLSPTESLPTSPPQTETATALDDDRAAWLSADKCATLPCYEAYLRTHPQGRFLEMAKANIQSRQKPLSPPPAPESLEFKTQTEPPKRPRPPLIPTPNPEKAEVGAAKELQVIEPEVVKVPGGCFQMGSPPTEKDRNSDEPLHQVCVKDFRLGRYEVTQRQWRTIMGTNPSRFKNCDDCPVEQVRWTEVQSYLTQLSAKTGHRYRLATEAEWEYACRSGGKREIYCGGSSPDRLTWHEGNSGGKSHPVGKTEPNGLGIYDMSGNVSEWTCSLYDSGAKGAEQECAPAANPGERSVRGGSWFNNPWGLRSANRGKGDPAGRSDARGFRLVLD